MPIIIRGLQLTTNPVYAQLLTVPGQRGHFCIINIADPPLAVYFVAAASFLLFVVPAQGLSAALTL
mgnify:FL=1